MQLTVKTADGVLRLDVEEGTTVGGLKELIAAASGVPVAQQRALKAAGRRLAPDGAALGALGVRPGDELTMVRGAPPRVSERRPYAPSATHYNAALDAPNVWELDVAADAVDEARALFERCGLRAAHAALRERAARRAAGGLVGAALGDAADAADGCRFFALHAGRRRADGSAASDMAWIAVDDAPTFGRFEALFRRLGVESALAGVVEHSDRLALYSAFFVVRSRCDEPTFHVDYARDVGVRALTLMTPLADYAESASFQLLYRTGGEADGADAARMGATGAPPAAADDARATRRYVYRRGKAIAFGAGFVHSTEPGAAHADDGLHAYLCFTFGTDRPEHWPAISSTIDFQSRVLSRPDGSLVESSLAARIKRAEADGADDGVDVSTDA